MLHSRFAFQWTKSWSPLPANTQTPKQVDFAFRAPLAAPPGDRASWAAVQRSDKVDTLVLAYCLLHRLGAAGWRDLLAAAGKPYGAEGVWRGGGVQARSLAVYFLAGVVTVRHWGCDVFGVVWMRGRWCGCVFDVFLYMHVPVMFASCACSLVDDDQPTPLLDNPVATEHGQPTVHCRICALPYMCTAVFPKKKCICDTYDPTLLHHHCLSANPAACNAQACPSVLDAPGAVQAVLRGWVAALLEGGRVGGAVAAQLTRALLQSSHPGLRVVMEPLRHLEVCRRAWLKDREHAHTLQIAQMHI